MGYKYSEMGEGEAQEERRHGKNDEINMLEETDLAMQASSNNDDFCDIKTPGGLSRDILSDKII